jgi:CheY-like chemotaxis protein
VSAPVPDVLLVEDDDAIRESLVESLAGEGYTVQEAADGLEALAWLRAGNRPRLVLLDLIMPRMSGDRFLEELRALPSGAVPVVLMTATSPTPLAPLPHADALLSKPFELAELLGTVGRFLGAASGSRSGPAAP